MSPLGSSPRLGTGFTLLEVLITLIILAIGMLGLANLQSKIHVTEVESYQRAHAVLLLQDMVDRINSNRDKAGDYVTVDPLGVQGDASDKDIDDCSAAAIGAARDMCEWGNALKGASEQREGANSGGMIGARGCVEEIQAADATAGVCTPGIYRVTVAWQGLHKTGEPQLACGVGAYGEDGFRRAISAQFAIGVPRCPPA
jgi:type IV pilus assembly protein PilV